MISKSLQTDDRLLPVGILLSTAGVLLLGCAVFPPAVRGWEHVPWPFVWRDVMIVCLLAGLPCGALLAALVRSRTGRGTAAVAGAAMGAIGAGLFAAIVSGSPTRIDNMGQMPDPVPGALLRSLLAIMASTSVLLVLLMGRPERPVVRFRVAGAGGLAAVIALLLVPSMYIQARREHDRQRLSDLLEQSRLGEAHHLVTGMLALEPSAEWNGQPLQDVAASIGRGVRVLEQQVSSVPGDPENKQAHLQRARSLAMLGRTDEAIEAARDLGSNPEACNLLGTIHETRADWVTARDWYSRARVACRQMPPAPETASLLQQATRGIAYCHRKQGNLPEAEAAYHQLLALAPTAQTHFLLARFYEDTQQATRAHHHARQAMALAPDQYGEQGRQLIDKLSTLHFGCLNVMYDRARSAE